MHMNIEADIVHVYRQLCVWLSKLDNSIFLTFPSPQFGNTALEIALSKGNETLVNALLQSSSN